MTKNSSIRPATPDDATAIHGLIVELAIFEKLRDEVISTPDILRQALIAGDVRALVADVDGVAAGYALYFYNFSSFLCRKGIFLEDIYVRPEHRGSGLAKAMLKNLATIAVAEGCGRMEWVVLDWNEAAIGFYKKLGVQMMDEWTTCRLTEDGVKALAAL